MDWKDVGEQLLSIGAPLLGTAIGGPAGGIVGKMIADEFGEADTPKSVSELIKIKKPDQFRELETKHRIKLIELANADRADARSREVQLVQALGGRDWVQAWVCLLVMVGFFAMVCALFLWPVPEANQRVVDLITGGVLGSQAAVVSYYFGASTKGEK